jgi:hypothetical protein
MSHADSNAESRERFQTVKRTKQEPLLFFSCGAPSEQKLSQGVPHLSSSSRQHFGSSAKTDKTKLTAVTTRNIDPIIFKGVSGQRPGDQLSGVQVTCGCSLHRELQRREGVADPNVLS